MNLVNKTSTITVAVVAALVAIAVATHVSGGLRLSPAHAAVQRTGQGTAGRPGGQASGSGSGQGSASAGVTSSAGSLAGSGTGHSGAVTPDGSSASGGSSPSGGSSSPGGSSPSGGQVFLPHKLIPYFPHTLTTVVTSIPSPTGTIGDPGVACLQGYVWRKAYAGDYVCVTPATRAQAAADNAAAVGRVAPGGGDVAPDPVEVLPDTARIEVLDQVNHAIPAWRPVMPRSRR